MVSSLPPGLRERPFTVRDGMREGAGRGRLAGADLARPFHGVRRWGDDASLLEACRAYAALERPDDAFSHSTAAELFDLPLPARLRHRAGSDIHVCVPGGIRARELTGVVGHRCARLETTTRHSLTLTSPSQTWLDLAPLLSTTELVAIGDALVSGPHPLCSRLDLARRAATPRARGVRSARSAIQLVREGVESPQETVLRLAIVEAGLPEPRINHEVTDARGRFVARVDLAYPEQRVALEYEGDHHRTDRDTWRKDITRRERVEDLGWRMVRVTADDLTPTPAELLTRIRATLRRR